MATKILVVDDEPDLGGLISQKYRARIKSGELAFQFAENGAMALEKLRHDPAIEVVFTDINMPVMDGLAFLGKVKEESMQQKAVVISAFGDMTNIRTAMNRGAFDFITKPIDFKDLDATLQKAITEMRVLREGLEAKTRLAAAQEEALQHLQEKEKIISEQNVMLEEQVLVRTSELREQKEVVEYQNKEILDSIRYAKRLQEAILPPPSTLGDFFPDSFIFYRPKDIVSGDFYWMANTNAGTVVAVADCTGHGVAGALMSMLGVSLLGHIVGNETDPARVLDQLHNAVVTALKQAEYGTSEGMEVAICLFGPGNRTVRYAGANRPLWIQRNSGVEVIKPDKAPIGGTHPGRRPFTAHTVNLESGDSVYMFSDGYADQFGGTHQKKLMTRNFREMVAKMGLDSQQDQCRHLQDYFDRWKGKQEQVDDVLVMGIRPLPA